MNYTFGAEVEIIDIDRKQHSLPTGCSWNKSEKTLVNSDGQAVYSGNDNYSIGGEVNTEPTDTLSAQIKLLNRLFDELELTDANFNYRCNSQIHIGFKKPLSIEELLKIERYVYDNKEATIILTNQHLKKPGYIPNRLWVGVYSHKGVAEWKHLQYQNAKDLQDFYRIAFLAKDGIRKKLFLDRSYVNFLSYFKTGSIEFRPFWPSFDINHWYQMFLFGQEFLNNALSDSPRPVKDWGYKYDFPLEPKFIPMLEDGFTRTKIY